MLKDLRSSAFIRRFVFEELMRILLTNDDGVYAPGLRALRKELMKLGDVTVVAPASEQSAAGHSITLLVPLMVQEVRDEDRRPLGWAVEGKPADCVKLALQELLPEPPDLIVSGLNAGSNAGINVLYSGTVAAAVEGAFYRHTSIACSLEYTKLSPLDFARGAALARQVVEQILDRRPGAGTLFNVNVPSPERGAVRGVRVLPQNVLPWSEQFDRRTDPRGRVYFWNAPGAPEMIPDPETDEAALADGFITVTPLQFNMTHEARLREMRQWHWKTPD